MLRNILKSQTFFLLVIIPMFFSNFGLLAQSANTHLYQYLSPVPNAKMVMPSTGILIRNKVAFSGLTSEDLSDIIVTGNKSGLHKGNLLLLENNNILSFTPFLPFDYGEKVTVELKNKLKLINGKHAPYLKYSFNITKKKINKPADPLISIKSELITNKSHEKVLNKIQKTYRDSLPDDFPEYTVYNNNPTIGYIFFSPFSFPALNPTYLIISDNYGIPIFYRKMSGITIDFKEQPNGYLTYYKYPDHCFYVMNSSYEIIDTLRMKNSYNVDSHELRILDNGHFMMFGYDPEPVRMDTIVSGGDPNAIVTGLVIQELDENKNLVFQWRSWDHFKVTDATINLTDSLIDYVHANAIEIDYDGNILLSCRHMDEITKINRTTGAIIWRWGGEYCKNNQFTFLNDPIGFSHQHHIRRLPNGNYTLFDNGNLHNPPFSRAVEYQMDQANKIVSMVWENKNDPLSYSYAMGSVQRLPNHNTLIGWGMNTSPTDISEVGPKGTQKLIFTFPDTLFSYRAFKFNWNTDAFISDKNNLEFGVVPSGQSGTVSFNLTNNLSDTVEINSAFNRNSAFTLQQQLPVVILPQGSVNLSVNFNPDTAGTYSDDIHLRWQTEGQRIAKIIHLAGATDSVYLAVNNDLLPKGFSLSQNYPNPFNPVSTIKYSIPHTSLVQLKVFDVLGKEIRTLVNREQPAGSYDVEFNGNDLASGIYIYRISAGEFTSVKKMLLLK